MERAKVYFSDLRAPMGTNLLKKLEKLIRTAGIGGIDMEKKLVAIKIHFGEPGNLSFLRPNYAKAVADVVKSLGGLPFLTDCNTLYVGRRKNALEHMDAAYENGFSPFSTGCQIIIGDGLKGTDDVEVPVEGAEYIESAKIGRAIKNIGMGCGSRRGKMEQHNSGKPEVRQKKCVGCRQCSKECGQDAISYGEDRKAFIDQDKCVGCGRCLGACNFDAIVNRNSSANDDLNRKMAEYAKGVVDGRPQFHISLVVDVSPFCDCHAENDVPILPDVGMFASFDPVALDQACVDACLRQPVMPGSRLDEYLHTEGCVDHHDHFCNNFPETNWRSCLEHAEKIGLGTRSYELIEVK